MPVKIKSNADRHFSKRLRKLERSKQLFVDIGKYKRKELPGRFRRMQSKWAEWAPFTRWQKALLRSQGAPVNTTTKLFETGRMLRGSRYVANNGRVGFYSSKSYWVKHQYGFAGPPRIPRRVIFEHEKDRDEPVINDLMIRYLED